jgi:phenylacetate-CoA ligase
MDAYGALVARVLYPAWESGLRRRPTLRYLRYLQATERRSADELAAIQLAALRRLLRHAYASVPLYRARFDSVGLRPEAVREIADLARLPLLTRTEAQATAAERSATAPPLPTIMKSTGGTTGEPLRFGYDADSEYWRQATKLRAYGWAGYRTGCRSLHYWGLPATPARGSARLKIAIDRALKRERYVDCTLRSDEDHADVVRVIREERPEIILCYTQAGAALARYIVRNGARAWGTIPLLCGAERLFAADRAVLEDAFGKAVFETYGCREVMLIGSECEAHDGLHVSVENLVVEVVVREKDRTRAARPGEIGEVVITDLHNLGMPFIRYANGDLATVGRAERCACGRSLPRIAAVEGRVAETLRDADGNPVSGLLFNLIFTPLADAVRQFQAVQHRDGSVTLKLSPLRPLDDGALSLVRDTCTKYLKGTPVRTEIVGDIPIGKNGKRQVVIVERG